MMPRVAMLEQFHLRSLSCFSIVL